MRRLLLISFCAMPTMASAQSFDFSIRSMMRGPELYGREPANVRWSGDGQYIYFSWLPAGSDWRNPLVPFRVRAAAGAKPEAVSIAHMDSVGPYLAVGVVSPDRTRRLIEHRGDVFVADK